MRTLLAIALVVAAGCGQSQVEPVQPPQPKQTAGPRYRPEVESYRGVTLSQFRALGPVLRECYEKTYETAAWWQEELRADPTSLYAARKCDQCEASRDEAKKQFRDFLDAYFAFYPNEAREDYRKELQR